ncbi:MAG: hypothetical protein ACFFDT_29970 [Candidatus Hodarchaeota archaeon]
MSETVSIEALKEEFSVETINPFGKVVVIPSRQFQPHWESELQRQGFKVFARALERNKGTQSRDRRN